MPSNDPLAHTPESELTDTGWSYYGSARKVRSLVPTTHIISRPLATEIRARIADVGSGYDFISPSESNPILVEAMLQPLSPQRPDARAVILRIHGPGVHDTGKAPVYLEGFLEHQVYIEWIRPVVSVQRVNEGWKASLHFPGGSVTVLPLGEIGNEEHSFGYVRSYLRSLFNSDVIHLES